MQASDLRPSGDLAQNYGVKMLVFGPPGGGKTPAIRTAPNPVLLATEPGMRSLKGTNIPTWEAPDAEKCEEFRKWYFGSNEARKFDTICVDSLSQLAEHYLAKAEKGNRHGLAAYGQMAEDVSAFTEALYFLRGKHVYLVCKEDTLDDGWRRPYFPGKELHKKIPHRYDVVMRAAFVFVPGHKEDYAFQTTPSLNWSCRARQNPDEPPKLAAFEPQNISLIISKLMS